MDIWNFGFGKDHPHTLENENFSWTSWTLDLAGMVYGSVKSLSNYCTFCRGSLPLKPEKETPLRNTI